MILIYINSMIAFFFFADNFWINDENACNSLF